MQIPASKVSQISEAPRHDLTNDPSPKNNNGILMYCGKTYLMNSDDPNQKSKDLQCES